MTSGKDDEEFFRQRGFGMKIGFGERPALLIIDMLKAFTDPEMMLGANLDKQIEASKPLLRGRARAQYSGDFLDRDLQRRRPEGRRASGRSREGLVTLKAGTDGGRDRSAAGYAVRPTACW